MATSERIVGIVVFTGNPAGKIATYETHKNYNNGATSVNHEEHEYLPEGFEGLKSGFLLRIAPPRNLADALRLWIRE